ncbi:uncharacterized protein LOC101454486 [Ceratitis capitata]|uniref:(Mediterranean fruit fly) hypothetical protein n=1 Tax=Ceratitis capitata TaxID=7213 RepID=A0A811VAD4_CERCA|nr:uncharacterized protein LOC101454486 [Ceratitis capitata]CAD7012290.1 unnamed protein product [Ceratitis capitata]
MLKKFFCFRLETAAMIIGWVETIGSFLSILLFGFCLGYVDEIVKQIIESAPADEQLNPDEIRKVLIVGFVAFIVLSAINLVASVCLLLGTIKERHLLILPWLFNSLISLLFGFIYYIILVAGSLSISFSSGIGTLLSISISLALHIYTWLAMYSHFKNIRNNRDQQEQLLRPAGGAYPSYTNI